VAINKQNPLLAYVQLGAVIGAVIVTVSDLNTTKRLASDPKARPLAYTSKDHESYAKLVDATFDHAFQEIEQLRKRLDTSNARWEKHNFLGSKLAGGNEVELDIIRRDIDKLKDQVFNLYTQKKDD
jgi:hypothetical protein